ncbi:hypothetical protein [Actinopolymorpha pittospori]|uniref:Alkylhydroperoxidase n=1 Tax=Actinopolymorpha pittospori TaxID=648752 RepID=A0A927MXB2_9ACTN|nr:hypothetical protein [Actinopolymorpha pittospori]MBE1608186.1 hypothetical protein [Actinopolymorpha pittospori]
MRLRGNSFQVLVYAGPDQLTGKDTYLTESTRDRREAGKVRTRLLAKVDQQRTGSTKRLADGGRVTDEAWVNAAKHFDEEQLMALVSQIAVINAFNRVITQQLGGDYQPGQFG